MKFPWDNPVRNQLNVQLTMAGNLYWGKHHAYAVMAMFPANIAEPAPVKTFESFSLIDPAK